MALDESEYPNIFGGTSQNGGLIIVVLGYEDQAMGPFQNCFRRWGVARCFILAIYTG